MGARLCCLRQPSTDHDESQLKPACPDKLQRKANNNKDYKTLEDYLSAPSPVRVNIHPRVAGGEYQVVRQTSKRVHPSASPEGNEYFFTPRMSFSRRLEKIDEVVAEEDDYYSEMSSSMSRTSSGKLKKKVSFKLPEEADIIFYSPSESFEE